MSETSQQLMQRLAANTRVGYSFELGGCDTRCRANLDGDRTMFHTFTTVDIGVFSTMVSL